MSELHARKPSTAPKDETAIAEITEAAFDQYIDAIFRFVYLKTGDRDLSKDLAQETFIRYWQCLAKGDEVEHERALLYRIAGNLVIDHSRKKKALSLDMLLEKGFEPSFDPVHQTGAKIELERVFKVLHKIAEPYRSTIVWRCVEGLEPAEIAKITGETSNVISVRIHRGLKQLQTFLNDV